MESRPSVRFSDGTTYDEIGEINFVDVTVDRATDTVLVRADISKPERSARSTVNWCGSVWRAARRRKRS